MRSDLHVPIFSGHTPLQIIGQSPLCVTYTEICTAKCCTVGLTGVSRGNHDSGRLVRKNEGWKIGGGMEERGGRERMRKEGENVRKERGRICSSKCLHYHKTLKI